MQGSLGPAVLLIGSPIAPPGISRNPLNDSRLRECDIRSCLCLLLFPPMTERCGAAKARMPATQPEETRPDTRH